MAGPNIANVVYTDTFDQWRVKTNQAIDLLNGKFIYFTSNSAPLTLTPDVYGQGNVFLKLAISNSRSDTSTANLATANAIYTVAMHGDAAFQMGNGAFSKANAANVYANTIAMAANAYTDFSTNSANIRANTVGVAGNAYAVFVGNSANIFANSVGAAANAKTANSVFSVNAYVVYATAAGNNYANYVGDSANSYVDYVGAAANAKTANSVFSANAYSNYVGSSANSYTDFAANSANIYSNAVGSAANAYSVFVGNSANIRANAVGSAANAYSNYVGLSGNNYAGVMANAVNAYVVYTGTSGNNYAGVMANSVNAYVNYVGTSGNNYAGVMANAVNAFAIGRFTTIANGTAAFSVANDAYANAISAYSLAQSAYDGVFDAANATLTFMNETTSTDTLYPTFSGQTTGTGRMINVSSTKLTFIPNTGLLTVTQAVVGPMNVVPSLADAWNKANAANSWANTKLANTSGAWFNGDLVIAGKVGIGANTFANNQLNLGSVGFNYGATFASPDRGNFWYNGDATGWRFQIGYLRNSNTFNPQITIRDTNVIGIGTTNPLHALDVVGTINVTSSIIIGGSSVMASIDAANAYTVYVGSAANAKSANVGAGANAYALSVSTLAAAGANAKTANVAFSANAYTDYVGASANAKTANVAFSVNAYANLVGESANDYTDYVGAAANAKTANVAFSANAYADYVGASANGKTANVAFSVNAYANYVAAAANGKTANVAFSVNAYALYIATQQAGISNNYTDDVTLTYATAGNNYTKYVGAASNNYAAGQLTAVTTAGNNYTVGLVNARLANTNGVATAGRLYVSDSLGVNLPSSNAMSADLHVNGTSYIVGSVTVVSSTLTLGGVNVLTSFTAGNNYMTGTVTSVGTAGNNFTKYVGDSANNYTEDTGRAGNAYTNYVGTAANNYTKYVGASVNAVINLYGVNSDNYTDAATVASNNYLLPLISARLANTNGITFNGGLNFTSDVTATEHNILADASNRLYQGGVVLRATSPRVIFRNSAAYTNGTVLLCSGNTFFVCRATSDSEAYTTVNGGYGNAYPAQFSMLTGDSAVAADFSAYGNITAYASDERLKENIHTITGAVEKVKQIDGVTFDWKDLSQEIGFKPRARFNQVGIIAQQIEKVLPQAVAPAPFDVIKDDEGNVLGSKSGENYLTVQYEKIVPLLIEAIKEQQKQIDELVKLINDK